jgi:hypothetical protein
LFAFSKKKIVSPELTSSGLTHEERTGSRRRECAEVRSPSEHRDAA